jgi:orotate phosphoribosyltransferase
MLGFCRKKPKEYGTRLQIEGGVEPHETVTIVEDVITSGGAALDAIHSLRAMNIKIMGLVAVVDREAGARDKFRDLGVDYFPLFTRGELDKHAVE